MAKQGLAHTGEALDQPPSWWNQWPDLPMMTLTFKTMGTDNPHIKKTVEINELLSHRICFFHTWDLTLCCGYSEAQHIIDAALGQTVLACALPFSSSLLWLCLEVLLSLKTQVPSRLDCSPGLATFLSPLLSSLSTYNTMISQNGIFLFSLGFQIPRSDPGDGGTWL